MRKNIKIASYNVNGIRAAIKKGFATWLAESDLDIICVQETKAQAEQIDTKLFEALGYHCYWYSATKKGYSGVGILTKIRPKNVAYGCEMAAYDNEGRVLRADFDDFSVMSVYMPSGSSGRQAFKMEFLADFLPYCEKLLLENPNLIVAGDYNIAHDEIDVHAPKRLKNTSGFLPEERAWLTTFFNDFFTDSFRHINPEQQTYSWWSYRAASRERNKGWRLDYLAIGKKMEHRLQNAEILTEVKHSDHCPVSLVLENIAEAV
jgi:exodeoxyribonuclease-3